MVLLTDIEKDLMTINPSELSKDGRSLMAKLKLLDNSTKEKILMLNCLKRAKRSLISDLKSEILSKKAGFNFSE